MKIKTVEYSALFNLGNYSNEKIGFSVDLGDSDTVEQVVEQLRQKAIETAAPNIDTVHSNIYQAQQKLRDLERKLAKATAEWNATAEFLRKQGLKPDAVDMPKFNNLLPGIAEEHTEVTTGELEQA